MDIKINNTPTSLETYSDITTTSSQNTKKRSTPHHSPAIFKSPKATKISTPVPDSTQSLSDDQISKRSAAQNPASPLYLTAPTKHCNYLRKKRLLSCYLQVPLVIYDPEEFSRCMENGSGLDHKWIVQHTQVSLLQSMLSAEMINDLHLNVDDIPEEVLTPELALTCLKECHFWHYESLPARLKTPEFNHRCLEASVLPAYLMAETALPSREIDYAALVDINANNIKYVQHQSRELCFKAITKNARAIQYINPSVPWYEDLCILSIKKDCFSFRLIPKDRITIEILAAKTVREPVRLEDIPEHLITYQDCHKEIRNTKLDSQAGCIPGRIFQQHPELAELTLACVPPETSPYILEKLPEKLKTEDFCDRYLKRWPHSIAGCPLPLLRKHPEWIERSLKYAGHNLTALPESERTFDLCQQALTVMYCCIEAVPVAMFEKHKSLLLLAASRTDDLSKLPPHLITPDVCIASISVRNSVHTEQILSQVPDAVRQALPYDLLLTVAPSFLPLKIRQEMVARGDTTLPAQYRQKKPIMDQRYLMTPYNSSAQLRVSSGRFLKKILLSTAPFNLRNQSLGIALQNAIEDHFRVWSYQLRWRGLPLAQPIGENSTVYGGRTLMFRAGNEMTRMKFQRHNETLYDFFREQAVHHFTHNHHDKLLLKSEVPKPVGLKLVPVEYLPDNILASFRSRLRTYMHQGKEHYLVYEFTTCNEEYSTLAHQKDSHGDSTRAEQGLLKACHDLGVWSSLGAVHTSTIQAYHNFKKKRRELILIFMFSNTVPFPGTMNGWDSDATDESDWSYSGLKDIGDMEFYPHITSYNQAKDAEPAITPGVAQRASFMSAAVENMIAPILHYARMHRDDADYHYKNSEGRAKLGSFIDDVIGAYVSGLLGQPVKAEDCFESPQIHQQWNHKTTAETTLMTARQDLNTDCFARNLQQTGCYALEVYPDLQNIGYRYPEDFTSNNGKDNLGTNSGDFTLTLLLRGLYQVAAFLAAELGQSDAT